MAEPNLSNLSPALLAKALKIRLIVENAPSSRQIGTDIISDITDNAKSSRNLAATLKSLKSRGLDFSVIGKIGDNSDRDKSMGYGTLQLEQSEAGNAFLNDLKKVVPVFVPDLSSSVPDEMRSDLDQAILNELTKISRTAS